MVLDVILAVSVVPEPPQRPSDAVDLTWSAPAGCPEGTDVARRIDDLLAAAPSPAEPLSVVGHVVPIDQRFALELRIRTPLGDETRHFDSADCDELARAAALIVATLADPIGVSTHVEALELEQRTSSAAPGSSIPPAPAVAAPSIATAPAEVPMRRRAPAKLGGGLRVDGFLGTGTLPRIDGGVGLSAAFIVEHARVEVGGAYSFASRRPHPELDDIALRISMASASLRGCGVPVARRWEFPLCGGTELGAMWARGEGTAVRSARTVASFHGAAVIAAHAVWRPTPRWGLWLGVAGLVHYARPSFTIDTLEPFFVVPRVGSRGSAGVEVRFP